MSEVSVPVEQLTPAQVDHASEQRLFAKCFRAGAKLGRMMAAGTISSDHADQVAAKIIADTSGGRDEPGAA